MRGVALAALALGMIASPVLASETPRSGYADSRVRSVDYDPQQVYRIVGVFRTATQVLFGSDETIINVAVGDSIAWEVVPRDNLIFIKPRERAGPTNLIVSTMHNGELRNYTFELTARTGSIKAGARDTFFQVRFRYPEDERLKQQRMEALQAALQLAKIQQTAVKSALDHGVLSGTRNLAYSIQGSSDIAPSEVSDNGQFTVLRFPANREVPAIYLVRPNGEETLVPFDVRDEFVVVHAVTRQLRLRRGPEVLCIYNEAPQTYGLDHGTDTASPVVERTMKEEER
ncbi:P-type conjugative transfer protein VirB9 [Sphingomonas prati]|nr:P-type conjugative transfer protein VirB9 [Sphingomonas prati]